MLKAIKTLIWAYVVLLILEGALRKWVFPGQADLLLIVRDPVLLLIYVLALSAGVFPNNGWTYTLVGLAVASVATSVLGGCDNYLVMAYGLRINYLHIPLIWVIANVLTLKDMRWFGIFMLLSSIVMTLVMIEQFSAPPDAWINKGIGLSEGGQIFGAEGRIRPPGLFAFITGPQLFYPICAAFFFSMILAPKPPSWILLGIAGISILIALPISISRTVMLATGIVGATCIALLPFSGSSFSRYVKYILICGVVLLAVMQLNVFSDGLRVFGTRWTEASVASTGDGWSDIMGRIYNTVQNPILYAMEAPTFGEGIGVGSNVGAKLLHGQVGFFLQEEEYGKAFKELGFSVGLAFISFRFILCAMLLKHAFAHFRRTRDMLPMLLFSATFVNIVYGQWAPPTCLGFAVVGAGFILACCKTDEPEPEPELATGEPPPPADIPPIEPNIADRRLPSITKSKDRST